MNLGISLFLMIQSHGQLFIYIHTHTHSYAASLQASWPTSQSVSRAASGSASQPASQPHANAQRQRVRPTPRPTHSGIHSHHTSTMRHSRLGQMLLNVDNDFMNAVRSSWHTISASFSQTGHACRMTSCGTTTNHLWMFGRGCSCCVCCVCIAVCAVYVLLCVRVSLLLSICDAQCAHIQIQFA